MRMMRRRLKEENEEPCDHVQSETQVCCFVEEFLLLTRQMHTVIGPSSAAGWRGVAPDTSSSNARAHTRVIVRDCSDDVTGKSTCSFLLSFHSDTQAECSARPP